MGEHHRFVKGEADWWEILDKYSTDAVLVQKGTPVAKLLEPFRTTSTVAQPPIQSSWYFAYEDDSYFILAKPATRLPPMSRIGEAIADGAGEALSPRHTHWNRKQTRPFYSVNMCSKRLRL